jgi:hypothetical protein
VERCQWFDFESVSSLNIATVFSHKFVTEDGRKIGCKSIYWRISEVWMGYRRVKHGIESFIIRDYYFLCFFRSYFPFLDVEV